jgi:S-adenosylhomocysteine hydrolase
MSIDLGALRVHEGVQVLLPETLRAQAMAALTNGFHVAFLACAALAAAALVACIGLRDLPLKSSQPPRQG